MGMVGGLDLHRGQITFDVVATETGEVWRGRIWQPDRERFGRWLRVELAGRAGDEPVALAVEGCTGWRYVVEEICAAGFEAHLAEPAETQAARGRKRRAKTDRTDAKLLREALVAGELPESWIPPECVLEWRERVRLYKSLLDQRTQWTQRIHAEVRSTWGGGARRRDPAREDPRIAHRPGPGRQPGGPPACRGRLHHDRRDRFGGAWCRYAPDRAGSGHTRPPVGRWSPTTSGSAVSPRWRSGPSSGTAGVSPGRCRSSATPGSTSPWTSPTVTGPAAISRTRTRNAALGALRGGQKLLAARQPRPRLLRLGQATPRRQTGRHRHGPQTGPALLPHPPSRRPRGGCCVEAISSRNPQHRQSGPLTHNTRIPRLSAPATVVPASPRAGRPSNTEPTALPPTRGSSNQDCCRRRQPVRRAPS